MNRRVCGRSDHLTLPHRHSFDPQPPQRIPPRRVFLTGRTARYERSQGLASHAGKDVIVATIDEADGSRRDFLLITTGALGAVGTAATLWPFVMQMAPDASTIAAGAPVEVDLSPVAEGQIAKIIWRGKPIFIRHLTPAELDGEKKVDPATLTDHAPVTDRVKAGHELFAVMFANCTHLGCVPNKNDHAPGWLCPCHGSVFDAVGRRRAGPAPSDLPIPPYTFLTDSKIRIG